LLNICSTTFYRVTDETSTEIFKEAEEKLNNLLHVSWNTVNTAVSDTASFYRYHSSFSSGLQEYIEAYSFWYFLKTKQLCSRQLLQQYFHHAGLAHIHVTIEDYVAGLADMSGEIMRRAISLLGPSLTHEMGELCDFLRWMANGLNIPCHRIKWDILQANVDKVENAYCLWNLRGSEVVDRTWMME
jgi:predicted translin family RNA/ssDNA-binding protein